jgi:nicotinate-nucleotide adenylyltransferase
LKRLRVGILGGTFDPVHVGHLHIARQVRRRFRLDEIWFLVARVPPHKNAVSIAPAWHRCGMIALATRREPRLKICDNELGDGSAFTIQTLRRRRRQLGPGVDLYFIAGADSLREFHRWRNFRSLLREFHIIFVARPDVQAAPGEPSRLVADQLRPFRTGDAPWDRGSFLVDVGAPAVSSTEIRRTRSPARLRKWVHPDVYQYIRKHRLYESH